MNDITSMTSEEKRRKRISQLKAKLQKEEACLSSSQRKARDGQLISFGIYVEELFKSADIEGKKRLEDSIKKLLSGRNLERAITGLDRLQSAEESSTRNAT